MLDLYSYVFHFDYGELSSELGSLHSPDQKFDFTNHLIWKHFNFLHARMLIFCIFRVRLKNHHNIFFIHFYVLLIEIRLDIHYMNYIQSRVVNIIIHFSHYLDSS